MLECLRSSEADESALKYADEKTKELNVKLDEVYLRRLKSVELVDILPNKDERIIYCPPSKLQKELYQHIIAQPDFVLVAQANAPCDCGVNRKVCTTPLQNMSLISEMYLGSTY